MDKLRGSKGIYLAVIPVMLLLASFAVLANISSNSNSLPNSEGINYQGSVCVYKNGELVNCDHNLLYDNGKDQIKYILGNGANMGAINLIALCNASAGCGTPQANNAEAYTAMLGCGLQNQTGTYASNGVGNWSMTKTFTSSCDNMLTNMTRITNSTGSPFAGNTFPLVTLQTNDQLTINWTISVS